MQTASIAPLLCNSFFQRKPFDTTFILLGLIRKHKATHLNFNCSTVHSTYLIRKYGILQPCRITISISLSNTPKQLVDCQESLSPYGELQQMAAILDSKLFRLCFIEYHFISRVQNGHLLCRRRPVRYFTYIILRYDKSHHTGEQKLPG